MPDFTARFTLGAALEFWTDDPPEGKFDRTNPVVGRPHRHMVAETGATIEIAAKVGGLEAPPDSLLSGRLFTTWWLEAPYTFAFSYPDPTKTSRVQFVPTQPGHYAIGMRRENGGAVILHLDVRVPP